jgi:hypothetical protein
VGLSWYTWLEQGRDITPSAQVLEALCRALQLSTDGREHLFALAGSVVRTAPARARIDSHTAAMVEALAPHPAYVLDDRFDVLTHNRPAELVLCELMTAPPERRNLLLWLFTARDSWTAEMQAAWASTARANLLDFRTAHAAHTGDPEFQSLVEQLSATSTTFRTWWAEHDVAALEPTRKTMRHPELGPLRLHQLQSSLGTEPPLRLRILLPTDEATRRILAERFG